jgi:hypothetical protein
VPAVNGSDSVRIPNFFIVGAPRCASTFMYTYLRQHPDVFMPEHKEPKFFCSDLDSGSDADADFFIRDEEEYLALFADTGGARRVGEACVFNLFSTVAAARIKAKSPDAKIIIMLRDPVEQMYSYHSVRRRNATEDLDFEAALAAEPDRREGRRLPRLARNVKMYQYRAVASYADQVARYFDAFGRENVHVIIYDDFVRDPAASYRATLEFLGVDPDFRPELAVVNANRKNISPGLATLLRDPVVIRRLKRLVPRALHRRIGGFRERLRGWNQTPTVRAPVDLDLRNRLRAELAADIARLGELLGRDLSVIW